MMLPCMLTVERTHMLIACFYEPHGIWPEPSRLQTS